MKKVITIVMIICVMLCGCTKSAETPISSESSTNIPIPTKAVETTPTKAISTRSDSYGIRYVAEELPYRCTYNDTSFSIKDVQYLSAKSGKSNELIVLVILDVANIPDGDDFEWFYDDLRFPKSTDSKEHLYTSIKDELTSVYLTNEKNDVKSKELYLDCALHYTDTKELYCFFSTVFLDDARYPYEDCDITVYISAKQDKKCESNEERYKINRVVYSQSITKANITPLSTADESIRDFVNEKIGSSWK